MKASLLIVLIALNITSSHSQQKPFRIYTVNDGLISNAPEQISQDKDGFVWIGSVEGMSIYDGSRFVNYTKENHGLSDDAVNGFFERSKDEMWVIHNHGVDVFVKRQFIKTLPIKGMNSIMWTKDQQILATGHGGLYKLIDDKPQLVFASSKQFFGLIEIGNYFLANETPWEESILLDRSFHVLSKYDHHGTFVKDGPRCWWFGEDKISLLDTNSLKKGVIRLLPAPWYLEQVNNGHIAYPFTDSDGFLWLSSTNGVLRIEENGSIKRFNLANGLNTNSTSAFFEDVEGNIWVGANTGYIKFFNKQIDIFSSAEGLLPQNVGSIAEDTGHQVWIAQTDNLSCIYRNKVYKFQYPSLNRPVGSRLKIYLQHDSLWLAFYGLYLFKIHYDIQPHLQLVRRWLSYKKERLTYLLDVHPYRDGSLLLNLNDELFRMTKKSQLQKIAGPSFFKFIVSGDELWNGPVTHGLNRWRIITKNDSLRLQLIQQFDSLPGIRVMSITKDHDGNFWVGTHYKGVIKFEEQKNGSFLLRNYDTNSGLPSNLVYQTFVDHTGKIIVNTSRGLCVLNKRDDSISVENLSRRYGIIEFFSDITCNDEGDLWLSAEMGAIRIRNKHYQNHFAPRIFITRVLSNGEPDSLLSFTNKPRSFSFRHNDLTFEFSATSYINENELMYSYQLRSDGGDSSWSPAEKIHSLSFASLSPGHYTFRVKALNTDDLWSVTPAEYQFTIRPPYYETWWFKVVIILFVVGIVSILYLYRLGQIRKLLVLRTKISRDLHDEIGSTLTSINILSKVSKSSLEKDVNKTSQLLEKITEQSDDIQQSMSDIVWAIHPDNDKMENIAIRMREYLGQTAEAKGLKVEFYSDEKVLRESLPMQQRKNIFLIFKEAVNNSVKYSGGKTIAVFLGKEDHHIKLAVHDDGIGIDGDDMVSSRGLKNMRERAKELNGELKIQSLPGRGTSIEFSCLAT